MTWLLRDRQPHRQPHRQTATCLHTAACHLCLFLVLLSLKVTALYLAVTVFTFSPHFLTFSPSPFPLFNFPLFLNSTLFYPFPLSLYLMTPTVLLFSSFPPVLHLSSLLSLLPLLLSLLPPLPSLSSLLAAIRPSALRSCSTGDSFLSQAFIRSAKSAPVLIHPLHPLLSDSVLTSLADELAGRAHYSTPVPVPLSVPPSTHFTSSLTICMFLSVFACCFYACLCL